MKVVYTKPTLMLTREEELTLTKAADLLQDICDKNDISFDECCNRCPLADYCEKREGRTIADLLGDIADICGREE